VGDSDTVIFISSKTVAHPVPLAYLSNETVYIPRSFKLFIVTSVPLKPIQFVVVGPLIILYLLDVPPEYVVDIVTEFSLQSRT